MTTAITLRNTKGSALTHAEMDANLTNLQTTADDALAATDTLTADKAEAAALGVANTDQNMGSFTGSTISDNVSAKAAIQALETAVETKANATAVGVTASAANMGTYTGATIPDNETAKQNIQSLETAVETKAKASALGVAASATHMGTYTGATVSDNQTAKQNIQELETALEADIAALAVVDDNLDDAVAASGIALGAQNYGTFTGSTISDSQTAKQALQALETAVETKANATAVGVTASAANMGTYTGATIPDNETAKQNIQSLETAVETKAKASALGVAASATHMGTYTGSTISDNQTAKQNIQQVETYIEGLGLNVKAFGAVGDGVTDDLAAINAAITALGSFGTGTSQDGGLVYFPPGIYYVSATIDLTEKHGVVFQGAGPLASEIKSTGNYPVITIAGATSSDVTNKVGFRNLLIRGGGKASASAHGITATWTNRCFAENILFFGCRNCLDIYHAWQFKLDNCFAHGAGTDQSYNFLYQGESTLANIDNAVIANGCYAQDCENAGFRIINGQGSKYTSCEAGACAYGWHIGAPTTGTVLCQWLHIVNCLGDSSTTRNWYFEKGSATGLGEMLIEGIWTGNSPSGVASFEINTGTDIDINGLIAIVSDREAIKLVSCSRVGIGGVVTRQHNNANGGYGAIKLEDTSDCVVTGVKSYSTNADISVIETGTANNNILTSLSNIPTLSGASSKFSNVNNAVAFEYRNGANTVGALIPAAGSSAYLGLGTTANRLLHYIERSSAGRLNFGTNSGVRFYIGTGVGASEFLAGFNVPAKLWVDTVANVTAIASPAGSIAYCSDGRKNGEGAGAGTGVMVFRDGTAWRACDTGATVAA